MVQAIITGIASHVHGDVPVHDAGDGLYYTYQYLILHSLGPWPGIILIVSGTKLVVHVVVYNDEDGPQRASVVIGRKDKNTTGNGLNLPSVSPVDTYARIDKYGGKWIQ